MKAAFVFTCSLDKFKITLKVLRKPYTKNAEFGKHQTER
jgi:hypothetical protein